MFKLNNVVFSILNFVNKTLIFKRLHHRGILRVVLFYANKSSFNVSEGLGLSDLRLPKGQNQ